MQRLRLDIPFTDEILSIESGDWQSGSELFFIPVFRSFARDFSFSWLAHTYSYQPLAWTS